MGLAPFTYACFSRNSFASNTKGPNGRTEAITAKNPFESDQRSLNISRTTNATYRTNKTPCNIPITETAIGISNIYFNGIAIPNRSKKDIPSKYPIIRNCRINDVIYSTPS